MIGKKGKQSLYQLAGWTAEIHYRIESKRTKMKQCILLTPGKKGLQTYFLKLRLSSVDLVYDSIECAYMELFYHDKAQGKLDYFNLFELQ